MVLSQPLTTAPFLLFMVFYTWSIIEYWFNCLYIINTNSELLNSLLQNSINKFHPALLYTSLLWLIILRLYPGKGLFYFTDICGTYGRSFYLLVVLIYTMWLGSWWALQEGSWGGWWDWDPSEVFGLVIILIYLSVIHALKNFIHKYKYQFYFTIIMNGLLIVYVLIQLNFDAVSHNFGTRTNLFINFFTILLTGLYALNVVTLTTHRVGLKSLINYSYITFNRPAPAQLFTISIVLLLFYSLRVLTLGDNQNNLSTNIISYPYTTEIIIIHILSITIFLSWGLRLSSLFMVGLIYNIYFFKNLIISILVYALITIKTSSLAHKLSLLTILLTTQTYQKAALFPNPLKLRVNEHTNLNNLNTYVTRRSLTGAVTSDTSTPGTLNEVESLQWFFRLTSNGNTVQLLQDGIFNLGAGIRVYEFGNSVLASTLITILFITLLWKINIIKITY